MTAPLAPVPPPPAAAVAGWYPDPWRAAPWRWWDGRSWTAYVGGLAGRRPRLPAWLSPPVVAASVLMVPLVVLTAVVSPVVMPLALVPLAIVLPALAWLDRVEPEPWASRLHAVLWGGTVAVLVAVIVNSITAAVAGETAAAVVSAPLVEEGMKGLGVVWALRRRELDGVMDGIVYAGWVALGFAVVEDVEYYALAGGGGELVATFVVRGVLTPFSHPLFTMWIGLAVGLAVARRRPVAPAFLWGWAIAAGFHATWNGSIALAEAVNEAAVVLAAAGGFVLLFGSTVVMLVRARGAERRRFEVLVPVLADRYGIPHPEVDVFAHWRALLQTRRRLPRRERRRFDALHRALARLAELADQPPPVDPVRQQLLEAQLTRARFGDP
ncbi:MAG: PrsW family intramembrane metalloprotease [Acidimicrobiales bacterium]|nr:PrsW family intramembrane metalloprotease [Acidimicrobiales bacterium]